jgi:hypothetical protein
MADEVNGTVIAVDPNPPSFIMRRKTFGELQAEYGAEVVAKAEVLAAMDCIMHHLWDESDLERWTQMALRDDFNWNILDWDQGEASKRTEDYVKEVAEMSSNSFDCIVHTFADIIRNQCFDVLFKPYVFNYVDGLRKKEEE